MLSSRTPLVATYMSNPVLFLAPLHKTSIRGGWASKEEVFNAFFGNTDLTLDSIIGVEYTRNSNAVSIEFADTQSALTAKAYVEGLDVGILTITLTEPKQTVITLPVSHDDPSVPSGLTILPNWISENDEAIVMSEIDSKEWDTKIKRRVQHYGFQFQYSQLKVDTDNPIVDFPPACKALLNRDNLADYGFNQLTLNEYVPGIGIASHCDTHSAFTDTIAVVSLCGAITMDFHDTTNKKVSVIIPARSLLLMAGESRYGWRHSIASRRTDRGLDGTTHTRDRRVSLTFRNCVTSECKCAFPSLCDSQGADLLRPRRMQVG